MLYVVGTSIGNIKDTTYRAATTLASAELILAEDTRTFNQYYTRILELFNQTPQLGQKIESYHTQNEFEKLPFVLKELGKDKKVALVSESGMPVISDPGSLLVQHLNKHMIPFRVIPGPTALTTAMSYAGLSQDTLFAGFLPKKDRHLSKKLKEYADSGASACVAYESPHRINKTLQVLAEMYPGCTVTICRELTKKFEEIIRGTPQDLQDRSYKGEITLHIAFNAKSQ